MQQITDLVIRDYILSMGLSIGLAVYIARAGRRVRGLTPENYEECLILHLIP